MLPLWSLAAILDSICSDREVDLWLAKAEPWIRFFRKLAHVIHEHFCCNPGFAGTTCMTDQMRRPCSPGSVGQRTVQVHFPPWTPGGRLTDE